MENKRLTGKRPLDGLCDEHVTIKRSASNPTVDRKLQLDDVENCEGTSSQINVCTDPVCENSVLHQPNVLHNDTQNVEIVNDSAELKKNVNIPLFGVHKLPFEMLTEIFRHLPRRERKNIKLVCKVWYKACTEKSFLKTEKFVFRGIQNIQVIVETVTNWEHDYLNLEFQNISFHNIPLLFWSKLSKKIYSLTFVDCGMADETAAEFIIICDNLISLSWKETSSGTVSLLSVSALARLLENNVIKNQLTSLEFDLKKNTEWSNYLLYGLFIIFPNIKNFRFKCDSLPPEFGATITDDSHIMSTHHFSFSNILKKIKSSTVIMEEIRFDGLLNITTPIKSIVHAPNLTGLKNIMIDINNTVVPSRTVLNFFSKQKNLQTIECSILLNRPGEFTNTLLSRLFDDCPNLRHVKLALSTREHFQSSKITLSLLNEIRINYAIFKKIVTSSLESFSLKCGSIIFQRDILTRNDFPTNVTMRSLGFATATMGPNMQLLLVKTFRNLRHLKIYCITPAVLKAILQYQTNLTSLELRNCQRCKPFWKERIPEFEKYYPIGRLEKLEYLEIDTQYYSWMLTVAALFEIFPRVKYFKAAIPRCNQINSVFMLSLRNLSQIEAIFFNQEPDCCDSWVRACSHLKRLRYLRVFDPNGMELDETYCKEIFVRCPALRVLKYNKKTVGTHGVYYRDCPEGDVLRKTTTNLYQLTEKVDNFNIPWMYF